MRSNKLWRHGGELSNDSCIVPSLLSCLFSYLSPTDVLSFLFRSASRGARSVPHNGVIISLPWLARVIHFAVLQRQESKTIFFFNVYLKIT